MGCAGFTCSKHSLCALNILYVMVSLLMIGIAAWGKWFGLVSSFQVVGGVIGVGVFLFFVALAGLIGAMKHHQVLLFFVSLSAGLCVCVYLSLFLDSEAQYMIILFMVFVVQFSVSSACLASNKEQQDHLLEVGWTNSPSTQRDLEKSINCCGFRQVDYNGTCDAVCFPNHSCMPCADKIQEHAGKVLRFVGGIGLFFSFTEVSHSCNTAEDSGGVAHVSLQEPEGPSGEPQCFPVRWPPPVLLKHLSQSVPSPTLKCSDFRSFFAFCMLVITEEEEESISPVTRI
ncbi:hypothetical protein INR49_027322, partial [Caranx melampygus]